MATIDIKRWLHLRHENKATTRQKSLTRAEKLISLI